MKPHFHAGIEHVLLYGVSALIFFNVLNIVAAHAVTQGGMVGKFGSALGAITPGVGN